VRGLAIDERGLRSGLRILNVPQDLIELYVKIAKTGETRG